MKWNRYTLKTTVDAVDIISAMLCDLGIDSIEIEDNMPISEEDSRRMFVDITFVPVNRDKTAYIHFYLNQGLNNEDKIKMINQVNDGITELSEHIDTGEGSIKTSLTDENDWLDNWKQFFKPFRIGNFILIKPIWEECNDIGKDDIVIELNPGRAFGTGSHETTKLCILAMEKYLKADSLVLDIGSGSGILSITAIKLGAERVVGTDIDITAVDSSKENALINNYEENKAVFLNLDIINNEADRNRIHDLSQNGYDLIVANMLAEVIIPLAFIIGQFMRKNGYFISSGILDEKADEVKTALIENNFLIVEELKMGEWVSYVAILK